MKGNIGSKVFDIIIYFTLIIISLVIFYPFLYTIAISLSSPDVVLTGEVLLFPVKFTTIGYKTLLTNKNIYLAYVNTAYYAIGATILTLIFTSMAAYTLAVKQFFGKSAVVLFFTIPMFFGGGLIPSYLLIRSLGLANTIWALILPGSVGMWNIILMRTNFKNIPMSLYESAFVDGASHFIVLFKIVLPLSKAILAMVSLYTIVGQWNSYLSPLLYIDDPKRWPIQVIVRNLISENMMPGAEYETSMQSFFNEESMSSRAGYKEVLKTAAIMVSIGPVILFYPIIQKYFVKGVLIGSIKG